jgi:hypothetical protein
MESEMRVLTLTTGVAAGLLGGTLAFAPPAHAVLTFSEDVSGITFTCVDNTACDTNPAVGQLQLAPVTVNGVQITGNFERSTISPFDLIASGSTSVLNNSGATRVLTAAVSDTNFVGPTGFITTSGSGTFTFNQGNGITLNYFADLANTQGANNPTDTPGVSIDGFSFTQTLPLSQSYSHDATTPFTTGSLFSMTEQFIYALAPEASLTSRGQTEIALAAPVLEPTSLALLGSALFGFTVMRRRKQA